MKALKKFLDMFCVAGMLLFVGLDRENIAPKHMIMITGALCGVVNAALSWAEKD